MLACVRLPCPVDLGVGHLVVCARTMRKRCLTDSKRPGRLRAECHLQSAMFCSAKGRPGMDWTLRAKKWDQGKECHRSFGIWDASRGCGTGVYVAGSGWSFRDTGSGSNFVKSQLSVLLKDFKERERRPWLYKGDALNLCGTALRVEKFTLRCSS